MRASLLLFLFIIFSFVAVAQIPNGDFENWTNGVPDSWSTTQVPGYETISQSTFSYSGYALSGQVVSFQGYANLTPAIVCDGTDGKGFPISQLYKSFKGYYAFKPVGGDVIEISILLTDNSGTSVAGGILQISNASDSYIPFAFPIVPLPGGGEPAYCAISISIAGSASGEVHTSSQMFIDHLELSLDNVSAVDDNFNKLNFALNQNYPNPFNPSTVISYQVPVTSLVSLKVYDVIGNEVADLVNKVQPAGKYEITFNAADLPSGIYFYQLKTDGFNVVKKMTLLK
jgi:hypothetical protein